MTDQLSTTQQPTGGFNNAARVTHEIDPDRLSFGRWDEQHQKHVGEGDIYASYSADRIAMAGKVRVPFTFQGRAWVCTGGGGVTHASTAYRLVPLNHFEGTVPGAGAGAAVSYTQKTADCAAARADPDGFYHGMTVLHRGQPHVLCGPPVHFVPGPTVQPGLFAGI